MTSAKSKEVDLPLKRRTPLSWGVDALRDPLALLNDHAHLEKKAASNALDLLPRWPQKNPPRRWVKIMSGVARDEVSQLATVVKIVESRGGAMSRTHKNGYAQALHQLVRKGQGPSELVDRLLISALIEARSCERFAILAGAAQGDAELQKLYKSLWSSEHGHYRVFVEMGMLVGGNDEVTERFDDLLRREADIIARQPADASMHGWV